MFFRPLLLSTAAILSCSVAYAQAEGTIRSIQVDGNQRVESSTIKSFLELREGSRYNPETTDSALKKIFATGLFEDVKLGFSNGTLYVTVVENPIINEIAFEGNKRISDEDLTAEVKLKPRSVFSKTALQADIQRILDVYQKSGRFSAVVVPKTIALDQNRVNLVFEIEEGVRSEIKKITFVGNRSFSDDALLASIQTKESRWYRFLTSDDNYDPDRMAFDQELLRRFYVNHGYADFRVLAANAELTPERDGFVLNFALDEGHKYEFGAMNVESRVPDVPTDSLKGLLLTKQGETFNAEEVQKTVETLTDRLGELGYAFVDIDPQFQRDAEKKIIGLNYVIKEGPRVYVENINIHGNVRTLDEVIRREFRLGEGDPYNATKLKRSKQRIDNLGFFNTVEIKNIPGSAPDKVAIDTEVEEKSTGELTLGAGFSTADGVLGDISLTERNLLGKGQLLRLNTTISTVRQDFDLGFTEPYFLGREIAAGFDLFSTRREGNSRTNRSYDLDSLGATLRASYPLTEHLTHAVRYSLRSDDITNIDPSASTFIQQQEGKTVTSLVGHSFTYDRRDNRFDPTSGYYIRLNEDIAGLGGDAKFISHELRGGYYLPTFDEKWVLQLSAKGGNITGLADDKVRINNRFFLGGADIRGFKSDGIGPRDTTTDDALGGNNYYAASAEYTFPMPLASGLGFSGSVFTDAGTLWDTDDSGTNVVDKNSLRASVGVGVAWKSPLGPVRISAAQAVVKEDFDETEIIRFSFGTKF